MKTKLFAALSLSLFAFAVSLTLSTQSQAGVPETSTLTDSVPSPAVSALIGTSFEYLRISTVRTYTVSQSSSVKFTIPLYVSVQNGTLWTSSSNQASDYAMTQLNKALTSFMECGVNFSPLNIIFFDMTPQGLQNLDNYQNADPYAGPFEIALFGGFPASMRPMAVFTSTGIAEAFNMDSVNQYVANQTAGIQSIANMAFVPADTDSTYNSQMHTEASFSLTAHELTHVTGNLEHIATKIPNLMSSVTGPTQNGDLKSSQCAAIMKWSN